MEWETKTVSPLVAVITIVVFTGVVVGLGWWVFLIPHPPKHHDITPASMMAMEVKQEPSTPEKPPVESINTKPSDIPVEKKVDSIESQIKAAGEQLIFQGELQKIEFLVIDSDFGYGLTFSDGTVISIPSDSTPVESPLKVGCLYYVSYNKLAHYYKLYKDQKSK